MQAGTELAEDVDDLTTLLDDTSTCKDVALAPRDAADAVQLIEALAVNFLYDFGVTMERAAEDPAYAEYSFETSLRSGAALERTAEALKRLKLPEGVDPVQAMLEEQDRSPGALQRLTEAIALAVPIVQGLTAAALAGTALLRCAAQRCGRQCFVYKPLAWLASPSHQGIQRDQTDQRNILSCQFVAEEQLKSQCWLQRRTRRLAWPPGAAGRGGAAAS